MDSDNNPNILGGVNASDFEIPKREHKPEDHEWEYDAQDGTLLNCVSCPMRHATKVPFGKVATKKDGRWVIIDAPVLR